MLRIDDTGDVIDDADFQYLDDAALEQLQEKFPWVMDRIPNEPPEIVWDDIYA